MPQIKELLFDCDNTLVLSEDIAFEGCAELANEVLAKYNIDHRYTGPVLQHEFVGMGFKGQLAKLQEKYGFTMSQEEVQQYVDRELGTICKRLEQKCEPCEGVMPVLERLEKQKDYGMAIVSSSAMPRVEASIRKTNQQKYFPDGRVFSAASSLSPPSSKPDPAIYLHACEKLGVKPTEAVAIEDSRSGATAAKNAGIPLLGYVGPYFAEGGKEKEAQMAKTLTEECGAIAIMYHWDEFDAKMADVRRAVAVM